MERRGVRLEGGKWAGQYGHMILGELKEGWGEGERFVVHFYGEGRRKTSLEEWRGCIQESLVLWGELATDNIILTVPTANLRAVEDPEPLLRF
ncbi:hypothetical protein HPG69_016389 [Diceros bicornis minor]|uniref:Peptidase M60 domain-containing protein n=1 Tax=Diceros bicornis minor TaxID=77932 RepID=A0A7J7EFE1_DICBM|nr:hypothetical protein HPG69_016389 [Diceros bicornis minor]